MERITRILATIVVASMLAVLAITGASAQQATPADGPAAADLEAATAWLMGQQADDGGFPGFSGESEASITIDAIMALVAASQQGMDTQAAVDAAMAWLASGDVALVFAQTGAGQSAKLVLGLVAAGADPRDVGGVDPVALTEGGVNPDTGLYGTGPFDHALVLLALSATGMDVPVEAITALEEHRAPEGGWAFDGTTAEGAADSNTTALVVQALVAAGESESPLVADALAYLLTTIDGTNGATFQPGAGFPPDSSSTAFVIQALIAVGDDPSSDAWGNLTAALGGFQNESEAFHFNADDTADNLFSTVQAIPAVAGLGLPIVPAGDTATPAATPVSLLPESVVARAA